MQANFYAYVLMQHGFTKVELTFVCVEELKKLVSYTLLVHI